MCLGKVKNFHVFTQLLRCEYPAHSQPLMMLMFLWWMLIQRYTHRDGHISVP